jgi:hypothetical protein
MSYLQQLRDRRKTPKSAWHKLKTTIGTEKYSFFLVFEGEEDEEFYSKYVETKLAGVKFHPIICDGKGGVQALQEEMIQHFGGFQNVFFIVDSDHDRFIGEAEYPNQTFNTCGYSVENYLQDVDVCVSAIRHCYQLRDSDPLVPAVIARVNADFRLFERRASTLMAYAVGLRMEDQILSLDELKFSSVFDFTESGLRKKPMVCNEMLTNVEAQSKLSSNAFKTQLRKLKKQAPSNVIRGKMVAQFVLHLIKCVPGFFKGQTKLNGKPLKSRIEIGKKNILHVVSEFIAIPPRFDAFVNQIEAQISK